jgi:hypothetical protein
MRRFFPFLFVRLGGVSFRRLSWFWARVGVRAMSAN